MNETYAQVLVDLDAKALDRRTFSYAIPEVLKEDIHIGIPVSVPFGRMKTITGYVVGFTSYVEPGIRVKEIEDVLDDTPLFDLAYLEFLDWVAQYYATPLITVLSAALPSSMIQKTRREVILETADFSLRDLTGLSAPARKILAFLQSRATGKGMRIRYVASQTRLPLKLVNQALYQLRQEGLIRLQNTTSGKMALKTSKWVKVKPPEEIQALEIALTTRQQQVLECLSTQVAQFENGIIPLNQACALAETTIAMLQKLQQLGVLEILETQENRDRSPLMFYQQFPVLKTPLNLNTEQTQAVTKILQAEPGSEHLLYGVTGSGKTEVYLGLTEAMLAENKSVLVMVPEISLTSHIAKRFIERFGLSQIALWHSHLSAGEKADTWRRIYNGDLKIIIGARSAIFTPIQHAGIIMMDEAHDGSFKQDSPAPRYHAQTLATELAKRSGAKLVLGSATPDVESYWHARAENRVLKLTQRYGGRNLAKVEVVDMHKVKNAGHKGPISEALRQALEETIQQGHQAIVLLNRRGFYTLITCNNCDQTFYCPNCAVALTYLATVNGYVAITADSTVTNHSIAPIVPALT